MAHPPSLPQRLAFTLIELMVVVGIIAVLVAVAVPNLLEARTRSLVTRVHADLRTVATALEAYAADWNGYPMNDGVYNILPVEITTPVAYIITNRLLDPFSTHITHPIHGELARCYTYTAIVDLHAAQQQAAIGRRPAVEAIDHPFYNPGALRKYGAWRLVSNGPDASYALPGFTPGADPGDTTGILRGSDIPYDPTNGTVSTGNILRLQMRSRWNQ